MSGQLGHEEPGRLSDWITNNHKLPNTIITFHCLNVFILNVRLEKNLTLLEFQTIRNSVLAAIALFNSIDIRLLQNYALKLIEICEHK